MDEKGYTITPIAFLLIIPVIIFAVAFGEIVSEINQFSTITIGSDVTGGTVGAVYTSVKYGAGDAGRWAAYNVTRLTIDQQAFLTDSKLETRKVVTKQLNAHVIDACRKLSNETGRDIYINNVLIPANSTNTTFNPTFNESDVNITQVDANGNADPFGFYVVVKAGVPIKVVQKDQVYEGTLPEIRGYAPIVGMEDPYVWIKSSFRNRNAIYPYQESEELWDGSINYHLDDTFSVDSVTIENLGLCLNGTGNPENISGMPQYFLNQRGLNFFERLQGGQIAGENNKTRISTFIVGDPLADVHGGNPVSSVDVDYFKLPPTYTGVTGITLGSGGNQVQYLDSRGGVFYLSTYYMTLLGLETNYN